MVAWLDIVLLTLGIINCFLHGLGLYLLWCLSRKDHLKIHYTYLASLSSSELIMNFLDVIKISIKYKEHVGNDNIIHVIIDNITVIQFTGFAMIFHFSMIFITLDKLFEILLNIKYPVYWNEVKAGKLVVVLWLISCVTTITVAFLYQYVGFDWGNYFFTYFYPSIEFCFVALALATYSFIFKKFNNALRLPIFHLSSIRHSLSKANEATSSSEKGRLNNRKQSKVRSRRKNSGIIQNFRKSRFFIPVLLILSFLIFIVAADMIQLFVVVMGKNNSKWLSVALAISYALANLFDALIYVFLEKELVNLLLDQTYRLLGKTRRKKQSLRYKYSCSV